jgi:diaminopimelate epimerase
VGERAFTVKIGGSPADVEVHADGGVTVDMGRPTFRDDVRTLAIDGEQYEVVALSIGNPHCVVFAASIDITQLRHLGPLVERHPAFPRRTNVQLAHVIDRDTLELLIWERGAGETRASGSSACAVVAAAQRAGLVNAHVIARMPGGELAVHADGDGRLWQRGPVEELARITLSRDLIRRLQALP